MKPMNRRGASLLETLVALTFTLWLMAMAGVLLGRLRWTLGGQVERLEQVELLRVAEDRVGRAFVTAGLSPDGPASDGLTLRSFRGSAVWCGDGWLETAVRAPDPARDSVWWVLPTGEIRLVELADREAGGCDGEGYRLRGLALPGPADGFAIEGGVLRWFEVGRLRVDDAVRYGRLGQPAQPLTPAILLGGSGTTTSVDGSVALTLDFGRLGHRRRWPPGSSNDPG